MDIELNWSLDPAGVVMLVVAITTLAVLVLCWWEFYAKPCRDSLRNIERALLAAPWMQSRTTSGVRRSA